MPGQAHGQRGQDPCAGASGQFADYRADLGGQAGRAPLIALQNAGQLFTKRLAAAARRADQATDPHHHQHTACIDRAISQTALVVAVHASCPGSAGRAGDRAVRGSRSYPDLLALVRYVFHHQRR